MSLCWYCHWGWAKQVFDIGKKYESQLRDSELSYGPGHIVWADENFETSSILWCIQKAESEGDADLSDHDFPLHLQALRELLTVPEEIRCCEPEGYGEDCDPRLFPPPAGIEMVKGSL